MSKFNAGDKVEVDLFGDGTYRPAVIREVSGYVGHEVYVVDVETCTADDPGCIQKHNGYLSNDKMTRVAP